MIPGAVAVVSLNTMYFYDSNKGNSGFNTESCRTFSNWAFAAVGGCEYKDPEDAGNLQFDWLDVQLGIFRSRGMKVCAQFTA